MLVNRQVLLGKIESTYRINPTPSPSTDAIAMENFRWGREALRIVDRPLLEANIGTRQKLWAGSLMAFSFDCEIKGSGTAGTPPEIGPLLRACGFSETVVASTSVEYKPVSTGFESIYLQRYLDGKQRVVAGCRGNVSFRVVTGERPMASFNMIGHIVSEGDTSLPSPTYDTTVVVPAVGAAVAIGGDTSIISGVNFDMGNAISLSPDMNDSRGFGEVRITKRDPTFTIDPEDQLVATKNYSSLFENNTKQSITTGVIGSTGGNKFYITATDAYMTTDAEGSREGIVTRELAGGLDRNTGDDEISLFFT